MGNEVATAPTGAVPDKAYDPATEITSEDVALPRVKKGEKQSAQDVPYGSIFTELGADDPDPQVIAEPGDGSDGTSGAVRFYVVGGPIKGRSYSEQGGDLETWRFDDPSAHPDSWVTYKYVIAIPSVEDTLPFTILLTRTSTPAARQLNTILQKAALTRPTDEVPLELTARKRKNQKGQFAVFQVRQVEVPTKDLKADLEVVEKVKGLAGAGTKGPGEGRPAEQQPDEQPAI